MTQNRLLVHWVLSILHTALNPRPTGTTKQGRPRKFPMFNGLRCRLLVRIGERRFLDGGMSAFALTKILAVRGKMEQNVLRYSIEPEGELSMPLACGFIAF